MNQHMTPHPADAEIVVVNPFENLPVASEQRRDVALEQQTPQVMAVIAQNCKRDKRAVSLEIIAICSIPSVADGGLYNYKRGGKPISGLTIDVVESIATAWGNITYGVSEVARSDGFSTMLAWSWDIQTNARRESTFIMPHERHAKSGVTKLTDPRDIYENNTNFANRRMRKCLERTIGKETMEMAEAQILKTLSNVKGLQQRISNLVQAYAEFDVTEEMIVKRVGHSLNQMTGREFAEFRAIYNGIRSGDSAVEEWFEPDVDPQKIKTVQKEAADEQNAKRTDKLAEVALEELQEAIRVAQKLKFDVPKILGKENLEEVLSVQDPEMLNAFANSINLAVTKHQTFATQLRAKIAELAKKTKLSEIEKYMGFPKDQIDEKTAEELAKALDALQ